ncbi:MAG: hypothetical protein ABIE25_02975 [Thermoplasmatota archaeon]|nr:hypothetical protein [Candidatus Thermoplasmatota archaeon]MBU1914185.1 hypothetical protein [Candidatus Thermoplasmatota archaeon]
MSIFIGWSLGLPDPLNGNIVPFLISGALGMFAVVLAQVNLKEKAQANLGRPPG